MDWHDIKYRWYKKLRLYWWRNGLSRVKRVWAWLPIICADRDWDAVFLYKIMQFKISRMRKNMEENARHVGYERNIKEMKVTELLLQRLIEPPEEVSGDPFKEFCRCPKHRIDDNGRFLGSCKLCFYYFKMRDKQENHTRELVFKYIAKHSPKWWD